MHSICSSPTPAAPCSNVSKPRWFVSSMICASRPLTATGCARTSPRSALLSTRWPSVDSPSGEGPGRERADNLARVGASSLELHARSSAQRVSGHVGRRRWKHLPDDHPRSSRASRSPPAPLAPMSSSPNYRAGITTNSPSAVGRSRRVNASSSRSLEPSSSIRRSCYWTKRPRTSTSRPRLASRPRFTRSRAVVRPSSSPTACKRLDTPTES